MKKVLWFFALLVLLATAFFAYHFLLAPQNKMRPIGLVPGDVVYLIEVEDPVQQWKQIVESRPWKYVKGHSTFEDFEGNIAFLTDLLVSNETLFKMIGPEKVTISIHPFKRNEYSFLFIADLDRLSKLGALKSYLTQLVSDDYVITSRTFQQIDIYEIFDRHSRDTYYLAQVENLLMASSYHQLVEQAILQQEQPVLNRDVHFVEINEQMAYRGVGRVYINYREIERLLSEQLKDQGDYMVNIPRSLYYSGIALDLEDEELLKMEGYSNLNDSIISLLGVLSRSGTGKIEAQQVIPERTASYTSLGFSSFDRFYDGLVEMIHRDPEDSALFEGSVSTIQDFLKIDLQENFIDWIDDEMAFVQLYPAGLGKDNEFALLFKAKSAERATNELEFVKTQIKRKTPVKFKTIDHRGYAINFLSIKGFFRILLGKYFDRLEKPYYTVIDDYVIFSNHPLTIKNFIDAYLDEETLDKADHFSHFLSRFESRSQLFAYVNTAYFANTLKTMATTEYAQQIEENSRYLSNFPYLGVQFRERNELILTEFVLQVLDESEMKVENKKFRRWSQIERDSINLSLLDLSRLKEEIIDIDEITPDDLSLKKYQEFHESGDLKLEVGLKNGLKHGTAIVYSEKGEVVLKGRYKEDRKDGVWKAYDENGDLINRERYRNGQKLQ